MPNKTHEDKHFYAIEFDGGFLKVGIGRDVESRVRSHILTAILMGSEKIKQLFSINCRNSASEIESFAIKYFQSNGSKIGGSREWFKGEITEEFKNLIVNHLSSIPTDEPGKKIALQEKKLDVFGFLTFGFSDAYSECLSLAKSYQQWIVDSGTYIPEFESTGENLSPFIIVMSMIFYKNKSMVFEFCSDLVAKNIEPLAIYDQLEIAISQISELLSQEGAL